jgi:hypothetical protein
MGTRSGRDTVPNCGEAVKYCTPRFGRAAFREIGTDESAPQRPIRHMSVKRPSHFFLKLLLMGESILAAAEFHVGPTFADRVFSTSPLQ